MTTIERESWPFPVSDKDLQWPEMQEKIRFLEDAVKKGCEAFRFGVNNYGATYNDRKGVVLERGRSRWELRLSLNESRRFLAYLSDFSAAGKALQHWCAGGDVTAILENLRGYLVVPPGVSTSYVISESGEEV